MKMSNKILMLCFGMTVLTSCTAIDPYTGQKEASDTAVGVGLGTASGAVLGALLDGGRGAVIGGALGAVTGGAIGHTFDKENEELRKVLAGSGVQVKREGNRIQLVMSSDVTFDTNHADIRSNFYPTLNSVATVLKKYNNNSITINGFTDDVGSEAYNQQLSERRAASVGEVLVARGVSQNRIFTRGFGKRFPLASNNSALGRAMNRRVVMTLRPLA